MAVVKAVLFDAVGTIVYPSPSVAEAYANAASRQGLHVPQTEIARRFRAAFAAEEHFDSTELDARTDSHRERQRWKKIVASVFPDARRPQELFDDLWSHFASPTNWAVYADVEPALVRLLDSGCGWGIASNFDERLRDICRGLPILAACRRLFVSSELGWRKPSTNFFRAAETSLELASNEILLVGDDVQNDYQAALRAGWQAVLLDREGVSSVKAPHIPASSKIASLADLAW